MRYAVYKSIAHPSPIAQFVDVEDAEDFCMINSASYKILDTQTGLWRI